MIAPRIYNGAEARALLDGATPGPYAVEQFGEVVATIDGRTVQVASASGQAPRHDMRGEHDAIRKANSALIAAAPDLAASVVHHAQRADALLEVLRLIAPRCRQEDCESYATRGQRHFDSETFRCDEHGGTLPELKHVAVLRLLNGGAS